MSKSVDDNSSLAPFSIESPAPLYARVKQAITQKIRSGAWLPNAKLPSESELLAQLGVSRMTINRALRELTIEGLLVRMQGVGTFVAVPKELGFLRSSLDFYQQCYLYVRSFPYRHTSCCMSADH